MHLFSGSDLVIYFFFYGFLAWLFVTAWYSLKEQKYVNSGILNIPILISPALLIILMIIASAGQNVSTWGILFTGFVDYLILERIGMAISQALIPKKDWKIRNIFKDFKLSIIRSVLLTGLCAVLMKTLQPILFSAVSLIPIIAVRIIAVSLIVLIIIDFWVVYIFIRKYPNKKINTLNVNKYIIGERISRGIWKRIYRIYPSLLEENAAGGGKGMQAADKILEAGGVAFAEGVNLQKLVWVLFVSSLLGDIIETVYVFVTAHVIMRRSSLVLGPFSLVWGIGAVVLTVVLSRVKRQNNFWIFVSGFFFGGVFEYLCSVFTEVFFGMKFWDYSHMPFNIDGRTNLLFMLFWGVVSLVWFKFLYPPLSGSIEKIPPVTGTVLAFVIGVFFLCNSLVTSMVMVRATERKKQPEPKNAIESFVDWYYPEAEVKKLWPNMNFLE